MINLKIQGRLGNQMFQYAFAKMIQQKYYKEESIVISRSKSKFSNNCNFCDENIDFNLGKLKSINKIDANILQVFVFYSYMLFKNIFKAKHTDIKFQKILNFFGIYYLQDLDFYNDFKKSKMKNKIIYGYFASAKYFETIKNIIENDFEYNINLSKSNLQFLEKIKNNNSVCLSVRRGDYLNTTNSSFFNVCNKEYYMDAINLINEKIKNPLFVVFSDDIEWCKKNMNLPRNSIFEKSTNNVYETFYLMKHCKNFIISNSTFHWWASYLAKNKNKIIVAPEIWNNLNVAREIYMENWDLIKIKKIGEENE